MYEYTIQYLALFVSQKKKKQYEDMKVLNDPEFKLSIIFNKKDV